MLLLDSKAVAFEANDQDSADSEKVFQEEVLSGESLEVKILPVESLPPLELPVEALPLLKLPHFTQLKVFYVGL